MVLPEVFQSRLHIIYFWKILWFCHRIFCDFPTGFNRVEVWWVWWNVFNADAGSIFRKKIFHALCFVKSNVVHDEKVVLFVVKRLEQFSKKVHECETVLCDVKIVIKLVHVRECTECNEFFWAPKERASWCFSPRKPDFLVGCCEVESCFVNCYKFITHILRFEFFLNSWRNAATFAGSFLMCWERGVIREKSSLWSILLRCLAE